MRALGRGRHTESAGHGCAIPAHTVSGSTFEFQRDEPLVSEHTVDRCGKRPERQAIAEREWRRRWTVFGARPPIAGAEHHRSEPEVLARERRTTGKPHFDRRTAWQMDAVQACGQAWPHRSR